MRYFCILMMLALSSCRMATVDDACDILEFSVQDCIYIDLKDVQEVELDELVVIGTIKDAHIIDSNFFIHSSTGLHRFDVHTGNLKASYSRKGPGPEEYVSLWSYNLTEKYVQLYDMNRKRILEYDYDGNFYQSKELPSTYSDKPFQSFVGLGNHYLGKRVYGGLDEPELALYDNEFRYIRDVLPDLTLRSGLMLHPPFTLNHEGKVLYCRYFSNCVYEIGLADPVLKYYIDFGNDSFNAEIDLKDEYEIIDRINDSRKKYAVNFSNFQEDVRFISFSYIYDASKRLAVYDKYKGSSYSLLFVSEDEVTDHMIRSDHDIYVLTQSGEGATRLFRYRI